MEKFIYKTPQEMGAAAGTQAAEVIKQAIENKGEANIILATGTSQFETLKKLMAASPALPRGENRTILSKDGLFEDSFRAWDVHLYRIRQTNHD